MDFSIPDYILRENEHVLSDPPNNIGKLSARRKKKKKAALQSLKQEFRKSLDEKKRKPDVQFKPPIYDDVYFHGLKTLDSLAGEDIKEIEGIVRFSDEIWKSKARFDPDVP